MYIDMYFIFLFLSERETPPRMAQPGSPEFDFAMRFKALYENEKTRRDELDSQLKETRNQLEAEMENFKHHEHANVLRLRKLNG